MGFGELFKAVGAGATIKLPALRNKRVAVDGYNFVHAMARQLSISILINQDHRQLLKEFVRLLEPLVKDCAYTYLVWDSPVTLPCKAITSISRQMERDELQAQGRALYKKNQVFAKKLLKKGFSVPQTIIQKINELLCQRFEQRFCAFVAPFEADQQMAWMFRQGQVDYVLSGDSDMLIYGVELIREWNRFTRQGQLYRAHALQAHVAKLKTNLPDFLLGKILKTCDYFPFSSGIVFKQGVFKSQGGSKFGSVNRAVQALVAALYQFFYATVFDFKLNSCVSLCTIPDAEKALLAYLPNHTLGPLDTELVKPAECFSQMNAFQNIVNRIKESKAVTQVQTVSVLDMFGIEVNESTLKIRGLQTDIDVNSIHEDFVQALPEEYFLKVLFQSKEHKIHYLPPEKRELLAQSRRERAEEETEEETEISQAEVAVAAE